MKKQILIMLSVLLCGVSYLSTSYSETAKFDNRSNSSKESAVLKYAAEGETVSLGTELGDGVLSIALRASSKSPTSRSIRFQVTSGDNFNANDNYTLGCYDPKNYYPLTVVYNLLDEDGNVYKTNASTVVDRGATSGNYDPLGNYYGAEYIVLYLTAFCDYGLSIDTESIKFINIFKANIVTGADQVKSFTPDFETNYYCSFSKNKSTVTTVVRDLENLIDFKQTHFVESSLYSDTYALKSTIFAHSEEVYAARKASIYKQYKDGIAAGTHLIRVRFTWNGNSRYLISTEKDGVITKQTLVPDGSYLIINSEGKTDLTIFAKNIEGKIVDFQLMNFTVKLSLLVTKTLKEVSTLSSFDDYYGSLSFLTSDVKDYKGNIVYSKVNVDAFNNINLQAILGFTLTTLIYVVAVVSAYFFLKNKFKNDEFRKMNKSSYIKNSIHGYIFVIAFVMDVLYIMWRATTYNNSTIVANALDPMIVVFSVISIIWFGYWVKYAMVRIKDWREKQQIEKLNLNKKVVDDGTK